MKILFLHGWNSAVGGVKPTHLKDHGHEVVSPAMPHEDFDKVVRIAQADFDQHRPQVVVGSSRGGAVAMAFGRMSITLRCLRCRSGTPESAAEKGFLASMRFLRRMTHGRQEQPF